jgi:hypothetical protein
MIDISTELLARKPVPGRKIDKTKSRGGPMQVVCSGRVFGGSHDGSIEVHKTCRRGAYDSRNTNCLPTIA